MYVGVKNSTAAVTAVSVLCTPAAKLYDMKSTNTCGYVSYCCLCAALASCECLLRLCDMLMVRDTPIIRNKKR